MKSTQAQGAIAFLGLLAFSSCCITEGQWVGLGEEPLDATRSNHTVVWTDDAYLIYGGGGFEIVDAPIGDPTPDETWSRSRGDGWRYVPAVDGPGTWSPLAIGPRRQDHSAVWTGSTMLVWGGAPQGPETSLPQPGLHAYDPETNTWTNLSSVPGAPPATRAHTAVWTGESMLVWGGIPYDEPVLEFGFALVPTQDALSTGGLYTPGSGWTTFDTAATLGEVGEGRMGHTLVWAEGVALDGAVRDVVLVWGGRGPNGYTDSGFWFDPAEGVGGGLATGPLSARSNHVAVWTGTRMLVHGGVGPDREGLAAAYDPVNDTWTSLPLECAPSARYGHLAAWTGRSFLVWGGRGSSGALLGGGGLYDTLLDEWVALPSTSAPVDRVYARGAWNDATDELLVLGGLFDWGGIGQPGPSTEDHPENEGRRFRPPAERLGLAIRDVLPTPVDEGLLVPKPARPRDAP